MDSVMVEIINRLWRLKDNPEALRIFREAVAEEVRNAGGNANE